MNCPCCPTGEITPARICDTCGVAMARGVGDEKARPPHAWRRRPDQQERHGMAEYAATKEDKQ